ncbi:MAG: hypothetical protein K2R98_02625 [Gemmataceae bacterium]|nr:hypothetical protein [Gemmataceae bacterium]
MSIKRTLSPKFVEALNRLYNSTPVSWWKHLVDDPDVFLAIRNGTINAYAGGGSIGRITWVNNTIQLAVHIEYLTLPGGHETDPYIQLVPEAVPVSRPVVNTVDEYIRKLRYIKSRPRRFVGDERGGENVIASRNGCVIDMEAGFEEATAPANPEFEPEGSSKGRVDLVCLNDATLSFTEAKLYSNSDLRSTTRPAVCDQLADYHCWLVKRDTNAALRSCYQAVLRYYRELDGKFFDRHRTPEPQELLIDSIPRLLVFGYTGAQENHLKKDLLPLIIRETQTLVPGFTTQHVRVVGNPRNLRDHLLK